MDLYSIKDPSFLKELNIEQLNELAQDIRSFLIEHISKTGGHLSSNLGIVELTIALHYVFDSPEDKIFFDVGHQCYVHKILTGRAKEFDHLRQFNGISGFQKFKESEHDVWEAGHSSTALSAAVAMAVARDLDHRHYDVIPVIGDGAMAGGESLEALNHLGSLKDKVIVILNDNQMSIGKSVGGLNMFSQQIRTSSFYHHFKNDTKKIFQNKPGFLKFAHNVKEKIKNESIDNNLFVEFGLDYIGPVDGHDIAQLIRVLKYTKGLKQSIVIHVLTTKGKGYTFAENDREGKWHGPAPFNIETGEFINHSTGKSWSLILAQHVESLMKQDKDICVITPAMIYGSSLGHIFTEYPKRSFDVGIAEEHAVTFTAGLSVSNKKPFLSVYSSFLQRGYDQINHDIARMNLPCLIAIDRCDIVGNDGPTHHGVFDIGMLQNIPNVVLYAPKDAADLKKYVTYAFKHFDKPYFIRIPRGNIIDDHVDDHDQFCFGKWETIIEHENDKLYIITYGKNVNTVKKLIEENQYPVTLVNAAFIKPYDEEYLKSLKNLPVLVYENCTAIHSLGTQIARYMKENDMNQKFYSIALDDHYSIQGNINEVEQYEHMDIESVNIKIKEILNERKS